MENVKIYYRHFLTFLIFVKVRPVRTKVTDTDRQAHTETDKPIAIDEILQICLKIYDLPFET